MPSDADERHRQRREAGERQPAEHAAERAGQQVHERRGEVQVEQRVERPGEGRADQQLGDRQQHDQRGGEADAVAQQRARCGPGGAAAAAPAARAAATISPAITSERARRRAPPAPPAGSRAATARRPPRAAAAASRRPCARRPRRRSRPRPRASSRRSEPRPDVARALVRAPPGEPGRGRAAVPPLGPQPAPALAEGDVAAIVAERAQDAASAACATSSAAGRYSNDSAGSGCESPAQHLGLEALDVDLAKARPAVARDQRIERGHRHLVTRPASAPRRSPACAARARSSRARASSRSACGGSRYSVAVPGAAPSAAATTVTAGIGRELPLEQRGERRLRLDRHHPRAEAPQRSGCGCRHGRRCRRRDRPARGSSR